MIPRGIEVLVKKASVDPEFRKLLLSRRAAAAEEIGLELAESEIAMLKVIAAKQLEAIIESTRVAPASRRIFLGKAASVMLAALGVNVGGCGSGTTADDPSVSGDYDDGVISGAAPPDEVSSRTPEIIKAGENQPTYELVKPGENVPEHDVTRTASFDPNAKEVEPRPYKGLYRGPFGAHPPGTLSRGMRPDRPGAYYGIRYDRPPKKKE